MVRQGDDLRLALNLEMKSNYTTGYFYTGIKFLLRIFFLMSIASRDLALPFTSKPEGR